MTKNRSRVGDALWHCWALSFPFHHWSRPCSPIPQTQSEQWGPRRLCPHSAPPLDEALHPPGLLHRSEEAVRLSVYVWRKS